MEELERQLKANEKKARKDRLSLLRIHEDLVSLGYKGGYDAVRRYARAWRRRWRLLSPSQAFVPLIFDPGEAYQFDWSHEYARLAGATTRVGVLLEPLVPTSSAWRRAMFLVGVASEGREMNELFAGLFIFLLFLALFLAVTTSIIALGVASGIGLARRQPEWLQWIVDLV